MPLFFNWIKRKAPASPEPGSHSGAKSAPETDLPPEPSSAASSWLEAAPVQDKTAETIIPAIPVSPPEISIAQTSAEPDTAVPAATGAQTGAGPLSRPALPVPAPPGATDAGNVPEPGGEPDAATPPAASPPEVPASASDHSGPEHEGRPVAWPVSAPVSPAYPVRTPRVAATVRATGEDGRIRWRGSHPPVHPGELVAGLAPVAGTPPFPMAPGQMEPPAPAVSTGPLKKPDEVPASPDATPTVPETISLRLEPILKQLPLELETPEIRALRGSNTQVDLPTQLVREQLADGRVVIAASAFAKGVPETERPVFEKLDPEALIPIPLQEIFTQLPVSILKTRSDQVEEHLGELIPTPFTIQAQEDAMRFDRQRTQIPAARPIEPAGAHYRAGAAPQRAPADAPASAAGQEAATGPVPPEALPNFAKALTQAIRQTPEALQAIFLRDDIVDLTSALQAVIHLPGVQGVVLNSAEGEPLAGYLGHLPGSAPVILVITELLHTISERFLDLHQDSLESVSFHLGNQQITGFVDGMMHLIVVHTARPFRPGVREKIHAFMRELVRLSAPATH